MIYKRNGSGLALESAAFGSGRIMVSEGSSGAVYTPNYFITDHLGSTRAVVEADGTVSERNDYLPFGGRWEVSGAAITDNRFRFSGKEDQTTGNLPYQDFGARLLGKKLPIWTSVDPLAEIYYSVSPYAYCGNDPIRFIDPDGMYFDEHNEKTARKLEKKLDKRISKLEKQVTRREKKGNGIGDRNDRISELKKSKTDISDMRSNENIEYKYASANSTNNPAGSGNPTIYPTGTNDAGHSVVTMYINGRLGSKLHEGRHGGQHARGEFSFDSNKNAVNFTLGMEVSAYRAQYSYSGKLNYLDASNANNRMLVNMGFSPTPSVINNIHQITPSFVNTKIGEIRPHWKNKRIKILHPLYDHLK